jgi:hypothetical protein
MHDIDPMNLIKVREATAKVKREFKQPSSSTIFTVIILFVSLVLIVVALQRADTSITFRNPYEYTVIAPGNPDYYAWQNSAKRWFPGQDRFLPKGHHYIRSITVGKTNYAIWSGYSSVTSELLEAIYRDSTSSWRTLRLASISTIRKFRSSRPPLIGMVGRVENLQSS